MAIIRAAEMHQIIYAFHRSIWGSHLVPRATMTLMPSERDNELLRQYKAKRPWMAASNFDEWLDSIEERCSQPGAVELLKEARQHRANMTKITASFDVNSPCIPDIDIEEAVSA